MMTSGSGFALTSMLEQHGMKVVPAATGAEGLERLQQHPNTDVVLLDIMHARVGRLRDRAGDPPHAGVRAWRIISLTAKAMKGDKEKALAAGASDYIAKPVDVEQLVSMYPWLGPASRCAPPDAAERRTVGCDLVAYRRIEHDLPRVLRAARRPARPRTAGR